MIRITDAFIDTLSDCKRKHGWNDYQLAEFLDVNHGTLSRWLSGGIGAIREATFRAVLSRLSVEPSAFEKGIVLDAEFSAKLADGLRNHNLTGGVWKEKAEKLCGVSYETILLWISRKSGSIRYDVYERICGLLGWDIGFRTPVPARDLPLYQNPAAITNASTIRRKEETYDSWDDPVKKNPEVLQFPVSSLEKLWVMDPSMYEKMARKMKPVAYQGKVRLYCTDEGKGPVQVTIVGGGRLVADGEKIAVTIGKRRLAVGRLHLIPVLVQNDTYRELEEPEEETPENRNEGTTPMEDTEAGK